MRLNNHLGKSSTLYICILLCLRPQKGSAYLLDSDLFSPAAAQAAFGVYGLEGEGSWAVGTKNCTMYCHFIQGQRGGPGRSGGTGVVVIQIG